MEPMNDDDLSKILRQWEAPAAPHGLEQKILARARPQSVLLRGLRWLLTGSVRIPVPVGLCLLFVLVFWAVLDSRPAASTNLSEFQQVKEFKPRIVRTIHDSN